MLVPQIILLNAAIVSASIFSLGTEKRSVSARGGYALQALTCPGGTSHCQSHWCCPEALTCSVQNDTTVDNICCNGAADCFDALVASPICADSSWGLFLGTLTAPFSDIPDVNATNGEFCCLPGQVGTTDGQCVDSLAGTTLQPASSISQGTAPTSGGSSATQPASATKTSSGSSGSHTSSSTTSTSTSASSSSPSSTTSGSNPVGSNSLISIAVSVACLVLGLTAGPIF